jgi:hypothetical protein
MTPKVRDILQAERDRLGAEISRLIRIVDALDAILDEPEANKPDTGTKTCRSLELAPQPAEEEEPLPALVDAATLPPLTPIQFKVFSVFVAAKGEYVSASQIDDRCAKTGAFGSLSGVVTKGYLVGRPAPGRPRNQMIYHVACFGAPTVLQDSFQHRGKSLEKVVQQQAQLVQQVKAPVAQPAPPPPQTRPPDPRHARRTSPEAIPPPRQHSALMEMAAALRWPMTDVSRFRHISSARGIPCRRRVAAAGASTARSWTDTTSWISSTSTAQKLNSHQQCCRTSNSGMLPPANHKGRMWAALPSRLAELSRPSPFASKA